MHTTKSLVLSILALGLVGCGGSGGTSMPPIALTPIMTSLSAVPSLDGYERSDGGTNSGNALLVGDFDHATNGVVFRSFVSFDISSIPAGAQIQSASLRMAQFSVNGAPHAAARGPIVVDHIDYGPSLDSGDFSVAAILLDAGTLFSDATLGYHSVDVTSRVASDVGSTAPHSQYRLRFRDIESEMNSTGDYVVIEDAENSRSSGNVPMLDIVYTMP